jgi:hypothetical protein
VAVLRPKLSRYCIKCETTKDKKAFVGTRVVCRLCWYYLTDREKRENYTYVSYDKHLSDSKVAKLERERLSLESLNQSSS